MRQAMTEVQMIGDEILPAGINLRFIREAKTLEETSNEVAIAFAVAVLVVLLVLVLFFSLVFPEVLYCYRKAVLKMSHHSFCSVAS